MTLQSSLVEHQFDDADYAGPEGAPAVERSMPSIPARSALAGQADLPPADLPPGSPSRYAGGSFAPKTFVLVAGLHGVLAALLLTIGAVIEKAPPAPTITSFDIASPLPAEPEPPEPFAAAPETAVKDAATAAPIDRPQPRMQLVPAAAVVAPSLPHAAPAAVPRSPAVAAAPAPIVPPDFSAAQLDNPAPAYPFASRKAREEGVVMLRVHVSAAGRAGQVEIASSSGSPRLDRAARETVGRWRFVPAQQAGSAIAAWVLVPITFALG